MKCYEIEYALLHLDNYPLGRLTVCMTKQAGHIRLIQITCYLIPLIDLSR